MHRTLPSKCFRLPRCRGAKIDGGIAVESGILDYSASYVGNVGMQPFELPLSFGLAPSDGWGGEPGEW